MRTDAKERCGYSLSKPMAERRDMYIQFKKSLSTKEAFYSMASKDKMRDVYAMARFKAEPYHLTELRKRKEIENAYRNRDNNGTDGV